MHHAEKTTVFQRGEPFNTGSPVELIGRMGLKKVKKNKSNNG